MKACPDCAYGLVNGEKCTTCGGTGVVASLEIGAPTQPAVVYLEVDIPGGGCVLRVAVTPDRVAITARNGDVAHEPGVPIVAREPEELRAAARVLNLAAGEMEMLRATRAELQSRARRYHPGPAMVSGSHGGA